MMLGAKNGCTSKNSRLSSTRETSSRMSYGLFGDSGTMVCSSGSARSRSSVVGTNGVLVPPKEYMPKLRKICDTHEVLLIADEVMTGWCRTGKWFAMDHWGVAPDILTTAKGITNTADSIKGFWIPDYQKYLDHSDEIEETVNGIFAG